jgi:predicted GNAT family N-acyltransferase
VYRGSDCGEKLILMAMLGVETAQQSDSVVRLRGQRPAETFVTSAVD